MASNSPNFGNVSLAWVNLQLNVPEWSGLKVTKKSILRQLTGTCSTGTLTGILGPSGAGKTSLLNVLSGTQTSGLTDGSAIYGQEKCPTSYYIPQKVTESMVGELTVRQTLQYAYGFKNEPTTPSGQMEKFITRTLASLLLDDSILDRPFSLCSGGEQKRVAIAQELMSTTAPSFLFLDEPTSGLDSAAALEVVSSLQALARRQSMTVIASIHAPNDETLRLFDQLYVLAKGGVAIYSGAPECIRGWLQGQLNLTIPDTQPPIEALIKVACRGAANDQAVIKLGNALLQSTPHTRDNLLFLPSGLPNSQKCFHFSHFFLQFSRLFRISFLAKWRSLLLTLTLLTLYITLLFSLFDFSRTSVSGCVPLNQSSTPENTAQSCLANLQTYSSITENCSYIANLLIFVGIVTIGSSAATFGSTVKVFRSEHRNGWYSLAVFYLASLSVTLLQVSLYAFITGITSYFLGGQHGADGYSLNWLRLGHYLLFIWIFLVYLQGCGHAFGLLLVDQPDLAIFLSVLFYMGSTMMNGFFLDTESSGNVLIQEGSSLLGLKFISRSILYTFYGLERCDWSSEFSIAMELSYTDRHSIGAYILRVTGSLVAVRLLTLLLFYLKFGNFTRGKWVSKANLSIDESSKILQLGPDNALEIEPLSEPLEIKQPKGEGANPFSGKILLAWRNLSLFAGSSLFEAGMSNEAKVKPILRNLNGQVTFGSLNALMGTSGAGKTSLLKVLNGRSKMRLSKETAFHLSKYAKIRTCFITQEVSGHLTRGLTARQMLTYASRLKNAQESIDHEAIALRWLRELDLLQTGKTKVQLCSGGEQKRLAVALELTAIEMPNCVCIDEPTSGLDSNSAEIVISALYKLTRHHPIAIITSIHQPTAEILTQFDQLYVLARGGVAIYSGPPSGIQAQLTSVGAFPSSAYPIESLIKLSCSHYSENTTVQALVTLTNQSWSQEEVCRNLATQSLSLPDGYTANRTRFSPTSVTLLLSRYTLLFRQHLWMEHLFFTANYLLYGLVLSVLFDASIVQQSGCIDLEGDLSHICSNSYKQSALKEKFALGDALMYTFFASNCFLVFVLLQIALSFLRELTLFRNEHRNGWYSSGSFYLAKTVCEVTLYLPTLLAYVAITSARYEPVRPGIYSHLLALYTLTTFAYQGFAHVVALLSRDSVTLLLTIGTSIFVFSQMLNNIFLYYPRLHYVYQFLSNFSAGRFFFEAVMLLQYGFGRCGPRELQVTLFSMGLSDADYGSRLWALLACILLYHGMAVYLLLSQVNPRENRRQRGARIEAFQRDMKHLPTVAAL